MINQFPENQTDFTSFCTVPGKKPYSNAMETTYNGDIKIFSDSIPRGIGMRDLNKFVREGKPKLKCFPGVTSNQLLHYLDVNLQDNNAESYMNTKYYMLVLMMYYKTVQKQIFE